MAYATIADLKRLGIAAAALQAVSVPDQTAELQAASDFADSYLRSRFTLPLTAWGDDLKRAVCSITVYDALSHRGYNPEATGDATVRTRYEDAVRWLKDIAANTVTPNVTDSATAAATGGGGRAKSRHRRGW